jgi:hypothetical protein
MFGFIAMRLLTRLMLDHLTGEGDAALQESLMVDPDAGPVIPASGGGGKSRWAAPGRGKRGGYRTIHCVRRARGVIWNSGAGSSLRVTFCQGILSVSMQQPDPWLHLICASPLHALAQAGELQRNPAVEARRCAQ